MALKDRLKKNKTVHYLGICLKGLKNDQFVDKVFSAYESPDALFFRHLGEENPERNIYLIYCDNSARGFFSLFNLVLDGLQFADAYHMTPVVEWGSATIYHEPDGFDGVSNSFEFFFKQPSDVSVEQARHSKNVLFYEYNHRKISIPDFDVTVLASLRDDLKMEQYLDKKADLVRRYIHFSDRVQTDLDQSLRQLLNGEKVLGVHVRGTDMNVGYNGHAKAVAPQEYLEEAQTAFHQHDFQKVFLATDEERVIDMFRDAFGDKLIYYKDVMRSEDGEPVHFSSGHRKNHKYLLGLEVLRDMYTLSACDGLIAGASNVSVTARIMKKSRMETFCFMKILNHGFNVSNIRMKQIH